MESTDAEASIRWMARLVLTAEESVMWCLGDILPSVPDESVTKRLRIVRRAVTELADHGVEIKLICRQEALNDNRILQQLKAMQPQALIVGGSPYNIAIVDSEMAVFRHGTADSPQAPGGIVIHDSTVASAFHHLMAIGEQPEESHPAYLDTTADAARHRNLVRVLDLMSKGFTDDAAAKATGMSVRTYRRHVATLMNELGARSRFQAGVLAARTGLLTPALRPH
ncbi:hypothetical protein ACFWIA_02495 [Streptomyces sp. NPDC127068]|uniref:hypothetical protein n=1 Tax=Streptomyces sp. NPDC127068 TaxID=3347127 RepID=UPI003660CF61